MPNKKKSPTSSDSLHRTQRHSSLQKQQWCLCTQIIMSGQSSFCTGLCASTTFLISPFFFYLFFLCSLPWNTQFYFILFVHFHTFSAGEATMAVQTMELTCRRKRLAYQTLYAPVIEKAITRHIHVYNCYKDYCIAMYCTLFIVCCVRSDHELLCQEDILLFDVYLYFSVFLLFTTFAIF